MHTLFSDKDTEGTAVNVRLLYHEYFHAESSEEGDERFNGQVGEMLMIYGVVFKIVNEVLEIRRFKDKDAVFFQKMCCGLHNDIKVIDVGEHIRADDHGGETRHPLYFLGALHIEELAQRFNSVLSVGDSHDIRGWVDTDDSHPFLLECAQERSDVASDIDDKAFRGKFQVMYHRMGEIVPMG